jgi:hypothetical protein
MTFLIFEQAALEGRPILKPTGETFKLAGRNLLYNAWKKLGEPLNKGWRVTRDELIQLHFSPHPPRDDVRLIIDFHPTATGKIGLIEPTEIYAYTWGSEGVAEWTPLMLKLRDVFYQEYEQDITPEQKAEIMNAIPYDFRGHDCIEFLYLKGDDKGWNWGRNGMTNAAFLHDAARDYFRKFF